MLTVSQLSKSFAGRVLFDDVSLQVNLAGARRLDSRKGNSRFVRFAKL